MPNVRWKHVAVGSVLGAVAAVGVLLLRNSSDPPTRVALIGDSYAVGLGPELKKLLPSFEYEGFEGTNSAQWANRSAPCGSCGAWLAGFKPTLVLVSLGTNDKPVDARNYQDIVRRLHGLGAHVVWIEPPAGVDGLNEARDAIARLGVRTIPATTAPVYGSHPKHPNQAGYRAWAAEIAEAVKRG